MIPAATRSATAITGSCKPPWTRSGMIDASARVQTSAVEDPACRLRFTGHDRSPVPGRPHGATAGRVGIGPGMAHEPLVQFGVGHGFECRRRGTDVVDVDPVHQRLHRPAAEQLADLADGGTKASAIVCRTERSGHHIRGSTIEVGTFEVG